MTYVLLGMFWLIAILALGKIIVGSPVACDKTAESVNYNNNSGESK